MIGIKITKDADGTKLIDNTFVNVPVGVEDSGKNTFAQGNKFYKSTIKETDTNIVNNNAHNKKE